jgi:small-conductance mechanosensitive channel
MNKTLCVFLLMASAVWAAEPDASASPSPQGETQQIVSFLNKTIVWYRQQVAMQQVATEPGDVLYANEDRNLADEVARQSFDYARARAQILTGAIIPAQNPDSNSPMARYQSLAAVVVRLEQQIKQSQTQADGMRRKLADASGNTRRQLEASLSELQSEIDLMQARRDALRNMLQFLSATNASALGAGTLQSQIEELAKTLPIALAANEKAPLPSTQSTANQAAAQRRTGPTGILALISDMVSLTRKKESIEQAIESTGSLADASKAIRTPLVTDMRALMAKGDEVSNAPENADPAILAQQKQQLDALTAQFKQYSAAVLPLGKQAILLDVYRRSLGNWKTSVTAQHREEMKSLIVRLVILGVLIGLIASLSEIWRRATFRYVQDTRRRHQFLLMRRIVVWIVMAVVVAFSFAAELGTLATFAGLLTAGVAVALQNVILSIAGYFFLIGRYGIRVGDRVQVGTVTGDVVDIGLVRLHIMETISGASDVRPTGRVVAFSNSVVFQPTAGLFKQVPGTDFVWHEITLTLAADSNYRDVEERLMGAVRNVYARYQENMRAQRRRMEQMLSGVSVRELQPESRLRLKQTGLEVVIRFPVVLSDASEIDDEMTRTLLDAIGREPKLKLVGTGMPNIQPVPAAAS